MEGRFILGWMKHWTETCLVLVVQPVFGLNHLRLTKEMEPTSKVVQPPLLKYVRRCSSIPIDVRRFPLFSWFSIYLSPIFLIGIDFHYFL